MTYSVTPTLFLFFMAMFAAFAMGAFVGYSQGIATVLQRMRDQ